MTSITFTVCSISVKLEWTNYIQILSLVNTFRLAILAQIYLTEKPTLSGLYKIYTFFSENDIAFHTFSMIFFINATYKKV